MSIKISFTNPNTDDVTLKIYRSDTTIDRSNLPAPLATLEGNPKEFVDATAVQGNTYYYVFETIGPKDRDISRNIVIKAEEVRGPGENVLRAGTRDLGVYQPAMPISSVIDLNAFLTQVGLTLATNYAPSTMFKYARKGKVLFVPNCAFAKMRRSEAISKGFLDGIDYTYNGYRYKVRLMTGVDDDPVKAAAILAQITPSSAVQNNAIDIANSLTNNEYDDLVLPLVRPVLPNQKLPNVGTVVIGNISPINGLIMKETGLDPLKNVVIRAATGYSARNNANIIRQLAVDDLFDVLPVFELIED